MSLEYKRRKYAESLGRPLIPRGSRPDLRKRSRVAELRKKGLSLAQIGAKMGVTRQAVSAMLKAIREAESPAAG
ncbi:MAG: helix-turn-helix domain-containing protein [Gemmataceae bacterium]